jgi:uncharacterized glyoxalase superfamily protein PhnB
MAVRSLFPILATRDLGSLRDFYVQALEGEVVYSFEDAGHDVYVSIAFGPESLGIGLDHAMPPRAESDRVALWFYVEDVDAAFAAFLAAGGASEREPADMPWGERVAQGRDPDGNLVNLATPPA